MTCYGCDIPIGRKGTMPCERIDIAGQTIYVHRDERCRTKGLGRFLQETGLHA